MFEDELLTVKESANIAKVSSNTINYWRQIGLVKFHKIGKHPRIWRSELNTFLKKPAKIDSMGTLGGSNE
jgi:excisionase family DNA binding protein